MTEEATFTVVLSETELVMILSAISYMENRQLYLANLARHHGREKESLARRQSALAFENLADKLSEIGGAR